jgi:hypothetical protein
MWFLIDYTDFSYGRGNAAERSKSTEHGFKMFVVCESIIDSIFDCDYVGRSKQININDPNASRR